MQEKNFRRYVVILLVFIPQRKNIFTEITYIHKKNQLELPI